MDNLKFNNLKFDIDAIFQAMQDRNAGTISRYAREIERSVVGRQLEFDGESWPISRLFAGVDASGPHQKAAGTEVVIFAVCDDADGVVMYEPILSAKDTPRGIVFNYRDFVDLVDSNGHKIF